MSADSERDSPARTRILFLGTPEFALPSLRALLGSRHEVVGVVAQPSRPAGRGLIATDPPTVRLARERGLPCSQPVKLHAAETLESLRALAPDLIVTAAFGRLLRPSLLALPPLGCWNLHASLLPRHRGASPVAASLVAGDAWTGVTLFQLDEGMDSGPMLHQEMIPVRSDDTTGSLTARLSELAADALLRGLERLHRGDLVPRPQPVDGATYARLLTKEDGRLGFGLPAEQLDRWVRAVTPWPGAFFEHGGKRIRVHRVRPLHDLPLDDVPGTVLAASSSLEVACLPGAIAIEELQTEGRTRQPATEWLRGAGLRSGVRLG